MRKRLHTTIAWILLFMLFYNMGGYLLVFDLSETINRNYIHQVLSDSDKDELLLLKITDIHSFTRSGNDEIIYNGKRYDVKKEFLKNGITYFYCIHDEEEEDIYTSLYTSVNNNSDAANENQNHSNNIFLKHLFKDYFLNDFTKNNTVQLLKLNFFTENDIFKNYTYLNILTPPPEIFIS